MSRVVFAISHSENGGAQVIWADLAVAFRRRGHNVSIVALYPGKTETSLDEGLRWFHCLSRPPRWQSDALLALRNATRYLREASPEVVFTALPAANIIFPLAGLLSRTSPRVFTSHHTPVSTYRRALEWLDGWIGPTRAVAGAVCVSDAVRSSLSHKARSYRVKASVIRNALPPPIEEVVGMLRYRRAQDRSFARTIVACGRLAPQKNFPVLIRAMAHVRDATLDIIGVGPDEAALKSLAVDCGVADRVHFLGQKSRTATLELIASRDVFVQPSLFEGHSLALVEAARIGLPIVVSNVPSQLEGVTRRDGTRCGLTHDPHDHLALAASVSLLLDDPEMRGRYEAMSRTLGDEISFAAMVDEYEALLRTPFCVEMQPSVLA